MIARNGNRVRLQHIRCGGKILTTREWVEEFCRELAERDVAYFDAKIVVAAETSPRDPLYAPPRRRPKSSATPPPQRRPQP